MSHSTSFILHYILDILAQNGLRKNSALINNNATRLYTKLATRCQFRKNRQKKNSSHLNLDLDIRAGNVKEKRKKDGEKRGEGVKKDISIKIVRAGVGTSDVHRRVRLA